MREAVVNTIGGHMTKYEALLDKTIARALDVLSERAREQGYDGVLGIRISHPSITSGAIEVVVAGTGFRYRRIGNLTADCDRLAITHKLLPSALSLSAPAAISGAGRMSVSEFVAELNSRGRKRETVHMALKAPGILIFTLSIILSLAVLFTRYFGANVPLLTGDTTQFYAMWGAYVVLVLGCIMRGL